MKTIWKFALQLEDEQSVEMPANARVIHIGLDPKGDLCLWAEVQPQKKRQPMTFYVVGTGNPMPDGAVTHLGSVVMGPFVWHVYG